MNKLIISLLLFVNYTYSQEWLIVSIINKNSKGIKYEIDDGNKISKKTTKDPSIVKLIQDFKEKGYNLNNITQVNQIDLNGVFPLFNNNANFNFQTTNLNLNNNLRTNLWFSGEKEMGQYVSIWVPTILIYGIFFNTIPKK